MQKPINILLIENRYENIVLIQKHLDVIGARYKLQTVPSTRDALNYLSHIFETESDLKPQLIIFSLQFPGEEGIELLSVIKQNKQFRHIPFLIFSDGNEKESINVAYALHANCFIHRPADKQEFERSVKDLWHFWINTIALPE